MSIGAEAAADQVVQFSLKGIEMVAKLSGSGAKNLAVFLYGVLKQQKRTKGKARLKGMLRSGESLKVFGIQQEDLKRFCKEAKRYGVLYCALRDKKDMDGICDIMVRASDAAKINRIIERFKFHTVDVADVETEVTQEKGEKGTDAPVRDRESKPEQQTEEEKDQIFHDLFRGESSQKEGEEKTREPEIRVRKSSPEEKQTEREKAQLFHDLFEGNTPERERGKLEPQEEINLEDWENPTLAKTEKSRPSAPTFTGEKRSEGRTIEQRPSIRKQLVEIRESRQKQRDNKSMERQRASVPESPSNRRKSRRKGKQER